MSISQIYIPCGGCGASDPKDRCFGCFHEFCPPAAPPERVIPDWPEFLMGFARHAAIKSKDTTQVGAVLVGRNDRSVLLTGFNGPPAGVYDFPERRERPAKYLFTSHAEESLINTASANGIRTEGCSVYVTHMPCSRCARSLIQAGIKRVVYGPGTTSMPADEFEAAKAMFEEARVKCEPIAE